MKFSVGLFLFAVLVTLSPVRAHTSAKREHKKYRGSSCSAVKPLFVSKNISNPPDHSIDGPLVSRLCPMVNGSSNCCSTQMENQLKTLVKKELQAVLRQNSHSIQGVLNANSAEYLEKIIQLSRRSENRTLESFAQVFQRLAPEAQVPIQLLYAELRRVLSNPGPASYLNDSSADLEEVSLHDTVTNFFHQLFPLVYRHSVIQTSTDITSEYSICLQNSIHKLRPFGDIPKSVGFSVARSVRSVHDFLRALNLGIEALELAESAWEKTEECSTALLRMSYCSRCSGYAEVKPCAGYCHNVLRGCLAHLTELDASWNGYVDSLEEHVASSYALNGLVKAEKGIGSLDTQISDAIMHAMEEGPYLEKRVRSACGPVQLQEAKSLKSAHVPPSKAQLSLKKDNKYELETQLSNLARQVLVSLIKSKGFFSSLSDSICADDSFAETDDQAECWNGLRIAQYTRTVVSAGLGAQKYNPELPWNGKPTDSRIIQLSDRLRQVRRALLGQASLLPESDNRVIDGSGSGGAERNTGGGPSDDEDNFDDDGSGSGEGDRSGPDGGSRPRGKTPHSSGGSGSVPRDPSGKTTAGSAQHQVSSALWAISLSATLLKLVHLSQ